MAEWQTSNKYQQPAYITDPLALCDQDTCCQPEAGSFKCKQEFMIISSTMNLPDLS